MRKRTLLRPKENNTAQNENQASTGSLKTAGTTSVRSPKKEGLSTCKILCKVIQYLILILLIPPFLNYASLQKEMRELMPEKGNLYDIGWGQKMFKLCEGSGPPTVIFDSPGGMTSDVWSMIWPQVSKYARVCVYDRAGLGFSERPLQNSTDQDGTDSKSNYRNKWFPFTVERMADDLYQLMTISSQEPQPFILVGAELGALVSQFYAQMFEGQVLGLVLVNPMSEDLFEQDGGTWLQHWYSYIIPSIQTLQLGAALGITRLALLIGLLQHPMSGAELPEKVEYRQKHLMCHPKHLSSVVDEHHFVNESFSQMKTLRIIKRLPDNITVTVITGNYYDEQMPSYLNKVTESNVDCLQTGSHSLAEVDAMGQTMPDILDSTASCSQPSLCCQSVTDSDAFSQASSQGSSWSVDNKESEVGLKNVNTALSLLSNGRLSPLKYQVNKVIDQLHPSSKRMLKRKATSAIEELLNCFAPGQSSELKKLIELKADDEKTCQNPNVTSTIIKLYRNSSDSRIKRQMLSLIVKDFTKQKLQEMIPDLTVYSIDQARLHASVHGEGCVVPKPEKHHRQRLDQEKLAHALDFFFNPLFHQVSSYGTKEMKLDSGENVEIPEIVRTLCHANLVNAYQAFCKDLDFTPLSRSSLFEILRICPASKRTNLKGLDNIAADGATAFNTLAQVFKQLKPFIVDPDLKDDLFKTETDLQAFNLYIKTDLKMHITLDDPCPDHCLMFSLSDPSDVSLQKQCNHEHDMVCDRCDLFKNSLINLKKCISELKDVPSELQSELLNDIEVAESNILSWKQHLSRCINQDRCRQQLLENLEEEEVLIIMDWAMKFLPMVFREKQSDWFGQKGLNWHISVCIFRDGESNLMHRTYAHIFDQVKQDWFAVVSILENTLCTLKSQLPTIKRAFIRSDNAGCYHCGNTLLSIPGISARTGIQIKRYDFSEAQDGKSYCDAKIAHLRSKIRQYVASGNNVKTGMDMKHAIDHLGGVMGCQAAYVEIDQESYKEASKTKTIWKGITKISNLEFRGNKIVSWKAFGIGNGSILLEDDVRKMHRFPISTTNLVILSDFTLPTMANGKIKLKRENEHTESNNQRSEDGLPQDLESSNCFTCIEPGCSRVFQTYSGFESHILLGKHNTVLNKSSTYDSVKIRWKETCLNITESLLLRREAKVTPGISTTVMGWALKKDRKAQRFTENVKTYLRGVFHVGEQSGRKANPDDVSRNMRVCRDENGQKMFSPEEYLQPSQISSFFSRMCVMARNSKQQTIDDEDLAPALTWIDTMEAMDIINS